MPRKIKHHFVPDPAKKDRAILLQPKAFLMYSLFLVVFSFCATLSVRVSPGVLGFTSSIAVKELLHETNKIREEHGLSRLRLNRSLTHAAENKATHMFSNNYWAHIAPDGTEPWGFILNENYDYTYAGENLAKNFNDSRAVVDAWYKSPTHRDNLLNPNYDEIGFAVVGGVLEGYETTLVVQMFGRPRDTSLIATLQEEESLLSEYENNAANNAIAAANSTKFGMQGLNDIVVDIAVVSKYLAVLFISFVLILLAADIWYTKRHSIPKFTGHTLAHIFYLIIVLMSLLFVVNPGKVL